MWGQHAFLLFAALLPLAAPGTESTATLEGGARSQLVHFEGASPGTTTFETRADPTSCPGEAPRRGTVAVPGSATLDVSGCATWQLGCTGKAFCGAVLGEPSLPGDTAKVEVFPAAGAKGRIEVPRTVDLPGRVRISGRLRGAGYDETKTEFALEVDVGDEGRVAFNVPAGVIDLKVAASNLAPVYRWQALDEDGLLDLGILQMTPGGSLLGHVIDGDSELPVADATVTALPSGLENLPISDQEGRKRLPSPTARSNELGSFQLTALTPGAYRLVVEHPDYLPVQPAEASVVQDGEVITRGEIVLRQPVRLSLHIDPPLAPDGKPWQAALTSMATGRQIETAEGNGEGIVEFPRLAPGKLEVRVDSENVSSAFETELDLKAADHTEVVDLPLVEVVGRVTQEGEPVSGKLEISPGNGDNWNVALDEEGSFETWTSEPPTPFIFLTVHGDGFATPAEVTHKYSRRDGKIELEVDLVDLEITGRVISRRGNPVRGAYVIARPTYGGAFTKSYTGDKGEFSLRPLQPGVKASLQSYGASREELHRLSEARPSVSTELVIRKSARLKGRVVGPSGEPVGGARVILFSVDTDWVSDTVGSDAGGHFNGELAPNARRAVLIVAAPGYPFWSACIDATGEASVKLPALGGSILQRTVASETPSNEDEIFNRSLMVNERGGLATANEMYSWARRNGGGPIDGPGEDEYLFLFPRVAPGRWAMYEFSGSYGALAAAACDGRALQGRDWVEVRPGETVEMVYEQ